MRASGRRPDELRAVRLERGYTRHAEGSVLAAFGALHDAFSWLRAKRLIESSPIRAFAAVSVGIYKGVPVLDLDYAEDAACGCDMNVVMTGAGGFVEVQGTAEGATFSRAEMDALFALARGGIAELVAQQKRALEP